MMYYGDGSVEIVHETIDKNGKRVLKRFYGVNFWGKPVLKSKWDYPYSYDEHILYMKKGKKPEDSNTGIYSDRLYQWGSKKHDEICEKHFGNSGQFWAHRDPKIIENFLRDYTDNDKLELIAISEGCNVSNGYPYWIFHINNQ